jgi:hypothetical protein
MPNNDPATFTELSDAELGMVAAGALNLNLSHLVNLNIGVGVQSGQNISVLSANIIQAITQSIHIA